MCIRDSIWVSGPLGASSAGLRELTAGRPEPAPRAHARPQPRTAAGVAAREIGATAMIDVSDGFSADLAHVLEASGVGCEVDGIPVAPGATIGDALSGGEDFELVWCARPEVDVAGEFARRGLRSPLCVGRCVGDVATRLLDGAPMRVRGWRHRIGGHA